MSLKSAVPISKSALYSHSLSFFNLPYIWGGDGSIQKFGGYDCSGFIIELLKFAGIAPKIDMTAYSLYHHFIKSNNRECQFGALVFFGSSASSIKHVGFALDDKIMINASGGGSQTTTVSIAKRANAAIKIEPILFHRGYLGAVMPDYSFIG